MTTATDYTWKTLVFWTFYLLIGTFKVVNFSYYAERTLLTGAEDAGIHQYFGISNKTHPFSYNQGSFSTQTYHIQYLSIFSSINIFFKESFNFKYLTLRIPKYKYKCLQNVFKYD